MHPIGRQAARAFTIEEGRDRALIISIATQERLYTDRKKGFEGIGRKATVSEAYASAVREKDELEAAIGAAQGESVDEEVLDGGLEELDNAEPCDCPYENDEIDEALDFLSREAGHEVTDAEF